MREFSHSGIYWRLLFYINFLMTQNAVAAKTASPQSETAGRTRLSHALLFYRRDNKK